VNATVPAALAVAGTALMAVAVFAPFLRPALAAGDEGPAAETNGGSVLWPALVETSAVKCDVAARIDLAEALGALQSAWSETILRKAYETEPDPGVRSAIAAALRAAGDTLFSSSQSLVT
jgi:HEAT repeat protein